MSIWYSTAFTVIPPKYRPMHLCAPPPKGAQAKRCDLSSRRSGANRSGSNSSGSRQYCAVRIIMYGPHITSVPRGR
ncbi:Uncharacterised protein [Mycobacteroides abscessus subsp. abscessus]|nr:Uncharacterised protein [Mycobacteroides abscessus subsp. abscessus]